MMILKQMWKVEDQVYNWTFYLLGKTWVHFFRLSTLGSPIEFKHIVILINETQTMLYFSRIFKFNVFEFN